MAEPMCEHCWGEHEPDGADAWVNYREYHFTPPFLCMCCGRETCMRQWAWGRTCGLCDTGNCDPHNTGFKLEYAHEKPPWPSRGPKAFDRFVEAVHATEVQVPSA